MSTKKPRAAKPPTRPLTRRRSERAPDRLFDRVPGGDRDLVTSLVEREEYDGWSCRAGPIGGW